LKKSIINKCKKHYPILDLRTAHTQQVNFASAPLDDATKMADPQVTQFMSYEWHFFDFKRDTELTVTPEFIAISTKNYISFAELTKPFMEILRACTTEYKDVSLSRIGLRYVDQIDLADDRSVRNDWFSYWKKYINNDLLNGLKFAGDDKAVSRQMGNIEMNYGECFLRFQYGIFNEDYPASVKKKQFILDTDVYVSGLLSVQEVDQQLSVFHDKAKDWYERAIKQPLRIKMGVVDVSSD
jgi:uncharacterized protein (TIGR04255 family)